MNPAFKTILLAAGLCAAAAAQAQQTPFYVGASAGASRLDFDFTGQVQTLSTPGFLPITRASLTDKEGSAYKLTLGYQAMPWLGVELDYVGLGKFANSYEYNGLGRFTRQGKWELDGINLSAVVTHQIDDKLSLHGRVGAFRSNYKYSETGENFPAFQPSTEPPIHNFTAPDLKDTSFSFGVGGMYKVNANLGVRLEWDRYTKIGNTIANNENSNGKFDAVDLFTVGVVWRF